MTRQTTGVGLRRQHRSFSYACRTARSVQALALSFCRKAARDTGDKIRTMLWASLRRCGANAMQRRAGESARGLAQLARVPGSPAHDVSQWLLKRGRSDEIRFLSSSTTEEGKMAKWNIAKTQANYAELSPMSFLKRVERVYPDYTSIIHGTKSFTWKQTCERCRRLAVCV